MFAQFAKHREAASKARKKRRLKYIPIYRSFKFCKKELSNLWKVVQSNKLILVQSISFLSFNNNLL